MDIELQSTTDPDKLITVLYHHWLEVLQPQGKWQPKSPAEQENPKPNKKTWRKNSA